MCNIPKKNDGETVFPHKHNEKNGRITFFISETPSERDMEYVAKMLKTRNIQFILEPAIGAE